MKSKGFTVIESVIVVFIIGILVMVCVSVYNTRKGLRTSFGDTVYLVIERRTDTTIAHWFSPSFDHLGNRYTFWEGKNKVEVFSSGLVVKVGEDLATFLEDYKHVYAIPPEQEPRVLAPRVVQ